MNADDNDDSDRDGEPTQYIVDTAIQLNNNFVSICTSSDSNTKTAKMAQN